METINDIGDERFVVFKQWILQAFENIDKPSFIQMYSRVTKHFNSNDNYNIIIELENFKKAVQLMELNYDAFSFCFALLLLDKDEKQGDFQSDIQLKKLQEMRDNGLKRGLVEEVVEGFMKASPKHFNHYLVMQEAMKSLSKDDILNGLAS